MTNTVTDRLRVPWPGGAKKVPLAVVAAASCVLSVIFLGCFSWTLTIITYVVILPIIMFSTHRFIRRKVVHDNTSTYGLNGSRDFKRYPRSLFYFAWLTESVALLLLIYFTQVIPEVKISPYENLLFVFFTCVSCTCFYLVRATSCAGFEPLSEPDEGETIENGTWRICGECERQVPRQASHCRTCNTCYLLRDHHCIW